MTNLAPIDMAIIAGYLLFMLLIGAWMQRRAGGSIESYFLAGRRVHWLVLGMSGSSTFFDITGTMWMVSVFYVLGMRGLWEQLMWGFPFAGFMLAYKAKWAYRSNVLTGMEWYVFRYGKGVAGQAARLTTVVITLTIMVMMLGYAGTGVGKFMEEFLPIQRSVGIPLLFCITGLYVILGGFYSVVYSDLFQTILLSFAAVYIAGVAFVQIDPEVFRQTVGERWFELTPVWNWPIPPHKNYTDPFTLWVLLWMMRGTIILFRASGDTLDYQRFLAARNEADASKIGLACGLWFSVRWGLVMGFTAFGLSILPQQGAAIDPERVLPIMINQVLPVGIKGLVLAGLIAAFMSTFDSTLNVGASFIVNDLIKPVWKTASPLALVRASYAATFLLLVLGILISLRTENIREIWNPINFALGSSLLVPVLLAPYWWRMNGWTHCISGACTLPVALWVNLYTDWNALRYFPLLAGVSLVSSLLGAFFLPATPADVLEGFYRRVRPFGIWSPVRRRIAEQGDDPRRPKRDRFDIFVALVGTVFFVCLYLLAMDFVLHNWSRIFWTAGVDMICGVLLYVFWWRQLASPTESPSPE